MQTEATSALPSGDGCLHDTDIAGDGDPLLASDPEVECHKEGPTPPCASQDTGTNDGDDDSDLLSLNLKSSPAAYKKGSIVWVKKATWPFWPAQVWLAVSECLNLGYIVQTWQAILSHSAVV